MSRLESFLNSHHPIYENRYDVWKANEVGLSGGAKVVDDFLIPFEWEKEKGDHFKRRKQQANYINFPERYGGAIVGQAHEQSPVPGEGLQFGQLGEYQEDAERQDRTKATRLYESVDGTGLEATDWNSWWSSCHLRAMATGHRWLLVEAPSVAGDQLITLADEQQGARPYLVEYSPLSVPNWSITQGRLDFVVIEERQKKDHIEDGSFTTEYVTGYYVHVRKGFEDLDILTAGNGRSFSEGGWWRFDEDAQLVSEEQGVGWGTYDRTGGRIPIVPFFYERAKSRPDEPRVSRSGLTELRQIATSYMNLGSAGDNDAIEGGGRTLYVLGIEPGDHDSVVSQKKQGGRVIGIPPVGVDGSQPKVHDSGAVSASGAIETRQDRKIQEAKLQASEEVAMQPGESGESKKATFKAKRSPRLALMAQEAENAQRAVLQFFEQRWTEGDGEGAVEPESQVQWPDEYNLKDPLDAIDEVTSVVKKTGGKSATLSVKLVRAALRATNMLPNIDEDEWEEIASELSDSINNEERLTDALAGPDLPSGQQQSDDEDDDPPEQDADEEQSDEEGEEADE